MTRPRRPKPEPAPGTAAHFLADANRAVRDLVVVRCDACGREIGAFSSYVAAGQFAYMASVRLSNGAGWAGSFDAGDAWVVACPTGGGTGRLTAAQGLAALARANVELKRQTVPVRITAHRA